MCCGCLSACCVDANLNLREIVIIHDRTESSEKRCDKNMQS